MFNVWKSKKEKLKSFFFSKILNFILILYWPTRSRESWVVIYAPARSRGEGRERGVSDYMEAQRIHFHREGPSYPMWPFVQHSTVSTSANKNISVHKSDHHWAFNFWWPWAFTLRVAHCTLLFRAFLLWLVHIWLYQLIVNWAVHN